MASLIDDLCVYPDVIMDICDIAFPDLHFDVIICNHVLEHVNDDMKAMSELYRVLNKNGWAILQVPIDKTLQFTLEDKTIVSPEERHRCFGSPDHVRLYGLDYKSRLEQAGFTVSVDSFASQLGSDIIERYRIDSEEDIYIAHKR